MSPVEQHTIEWIFRRGICGSFFLSFSFSCSQVVNFLKWKHHYLSENIAIFHSNYDLFTQYLFLNEKRCHLMTFSWQLESKKMRVTGKSNHKFRTYVMIGRLVHEALHNNQICLCAKYSTWKFWSTMHYILGNFF